jgi:hypothetical protein
MTDRPFLTPRECAERLAIPGVTPDYLRAEIRAGLLTAEIIDRPVRPGRQRSTPIIRVYKQDFRVYVERYWPRFLDHAFPPA